MPFILCRHPALAGTEPLAAHTKLELGRVVCTTLLQMHKSVTVPHAEPLAAHTKLELGRVVGSKVAKSDGGAMRVQANVIPAFKPVSG